MNSGTNEHQSTGQKVASMIPGTEANKEKKMAQEGSGLGTGHHQQGDERFGAQNTTGTGAGLGTHNAAGTGTGYTNTGAGTGYAGAGTHTHGAGGMGTGLAATGGLVGEPTPGRLGEHAHHTGTGHHHTGTGVTGATHTGTGLTGTGAGATHTGTGAHTHGAGVGSAADEEGHKEGMGTKIKKMIPGTEENKLKKEGLL
jgi:hypothetical protein